MSEHKKALIRILAVSVALAAAIAIDKLVEPKWYISLIMYGAVYLAIGWDVLWRAAKNIVRGKVLDESFLMAIATVGAFWISQYPEAVAVMLFYQIGELFQDYAVGKSKRSIAALMDIRPDKAVILVDGKEAVVHPKDINVGDVIVVRPGERVPLDGAIVWGRSSLDTSALTGESLPRTAEKGGKILSGSINLDGVIHIRAEKLFYESTVSKILDLVQNASAKKAKTENFISRFAKYYTPIVVACAILLAVIPPLIDGRWSEWILRALTFLVVSCPCALVISVPLGFFGGIGGASKKGVLIKGAASLEVIARAKTFVFDKTGTLTKGVFEVQEVVPESRRNEILRIAATAETGSLHPIAKSIIKAAQTDFESGYLTEEFSGKGLAARKNGDVILCGNGKLMEEHGIAYEPQDESEGSIVYVARNGVYEGNIVIADTVRQEASGIIAALKREGIATYMLSGDNDAFASRIAKEVGVDAYKAELLPQDKVAELETIMESRRKHGAVAFVGDGINDAPVLMRSDVGISMGGIGSDSAIEASDIVLMHDKLDCIAEVKKRAKKTLSIVRQNIIFALSVKFAVLILGALGIAPLWLAVFADVGVSVLAVLNAIRAGAQPKVAQ